MLLATSKTFISHEFPLSGGDTLEELAVAYETWGTLNADASNGILLCHGYTSSHHAGGDARGWMSNLLGPGKAVDTDKYFVVCSNMLGSAYGTTGPASINPKSGKPFGPDFPKFSALDMVAAQERLIDHLGIGQLKAVMGYSYGGHLTLLWGATRPDRMRALVSIAGVIERKTTPEEVQAIRELFADIPGWNDGHYYESDNRDAVYERLVQYRLDRLRTTGIVDHLEATVSDPDECERMIVADARDWAAEFDANSLSVLLEAGIGSSAVALAGQYKAPILSALSSTDKLVDINLGQPTVDMLKSHGVDARFHRIDTDYGHAGPMLDAHKWSDVLAAFLAETP